ncbi:hypothetical protein OHC33_006003 [Knufia fluminis]|uniref:Microbial-type PARG catalytic domain-containing protein n=1 Tax=Knufia fluminis TaxID=191047 RepID=A0AAN8IM68_9EURO|nr:hypothetical protein OHC33_006003 [Knufia fluminis]
MGRTVPSIGAPPPSQRKDARAKRAKQTVNKDIPALLQAYSRARRGIEASELIVDPPAAEFESEDKTSKGRGVNSKDVKQSIETAANHPAKASMDGSASSSIPFEIHFRVADTLDAATDLHRSSQSRSPKSSRIAVLNMASPLRPGGGFLNGATSQEESLCMRTTLYPSLKEEFYRLPEVGAIYTPDVLVFRSHDAEATDLPKNERFFVDVITAAMHRMPDVEEDEEGEKAYADDKDRDAAEQKMRAVMRIAKSKGVKKLVLGAWGCGAYRNPVSEIAAAWKRVLLSGGHASPRTNRKQNSSSAERWSGMRVVFAIKERKIAESFAACFGVELNEGSDSLGQRDIAKDDDDDDGGNEADDDELQAKIDELESQIATTRSDVLKDRLRSVLDKLKTSG